MFDHLLRLKNPPVVRGIFVFFLSGLLLASHVLHLPFFGYRRSYLSQEVFILLFLDLLVVYFLTGRKLPQLSLNAIQCCALLGMVVVVATNPGDSLGAAVIMMYLLLLILGHSLAQGRFILLALSFAAIIVTEWSFYQHLGGHLGVLEQVPRARMYGIYGQPNLLACFILLGMACYCQLLVDLSRRHLVHFLPLFILSSGLFLTASRAALLGMSVASLIVLLILYRKKNCRHLYSYFVAVGSTLVVAYLAVAYQTVTLSGVSSAVSRNTSELAKVDGSVNSYQRFNDWHSAFEMGRDHLLSGAGTGHFKMLLGKYSIKSAETLHFTYDSISQTQWAHNDFLHIFAENGLVVAGLLLLICGVLIRHAINSFSQEMVFPLFAVLAFMLMMCFGHPFRYHALVFSLVLMMSHLLRNARPVLVLSRKTMVVLLLVTLVFVNLVMVRHFIRSYNLGLFVTEMAATEKYSAERYFRAKQDYLSDALRDSLYAWQFQHETYTEMSKFIFDNDDRLFAEQILPEMLAYAEQNSFASYSYQLARVFYVTGDYESAMGYARQAYDRDPAREFYFDFAHVIQVLIISRDNAIPLKQLYGDMVFQFLCDSGTIKERQYDAKSLIAL